jgi:hypothetical protein
MPTPFLLVHRPHPERGASSFVTFPSKTAIPTKMFEKSGLTAALGSAPSDGNAKSRKKA